MGPHDQIEVDVDLHDILDITLAGEGEGFIYQAAETDWFINNLDKTNLDVLVNHSEEDIGGMSSNSSDADGFCDGSDIEFDTWTMHLGIIEDYNFFNFDGYIAEYVAYPFRTDMVYQDKDATLLSDGYMCNNLRDAIRRNNEIDYFGFDNSAAEGIVFIGFNEHPWQSFGNYCHGWSFDLESSYDSKNLPRAFIRKIGSNVSDGSNKPQLDGSTVWLSDSASIHANQDPMIVISESRVDIFVNVCPSAGGKHTVTINGAPEGYEEGLDAGTVLRTYTRETCEANVVGSYAAQQHFGRQLKTTTLLKAI